MDKKKLFLLGIVSKIILTLFFFIINSEGFTQQTQTTDMMRSNGKIYVVVAVCLTILIGLFLYVFAIDKKIKKMEKENN